MSDPRRRNDVTQKNCFVCKKLIISILPCGPSWKRCLQKLYSDVIGTRPDEFQQCCKLCERILYDLKQKLEDFEFCKREKDKAILNLRKMVQYFQPTQCIVNMADSTVEEDENLLENISGSTQWDHASVPSSLNEVVSMTTSKEETNVPKSTLEDVAKKTVISITKLDSVNSNSYDDKKLSDCISNLSNALRSKSSSASTSKASQVGTPVTSNSNNYSSKEICTSNQKKTKATQNEDLTVLTVAESSVNSDLHDKKERVPELHENAGLMKNINQLPQLLPCKEFIEPNSPAAEEIFCPAESIAVESLPVTREMQPISEDSAEQQPLTNPTPFSDIVPAYSQQELLESSSKVIFLDENDEIILEVPSSDVEFLATTDLENVPNSYIGSNSNQVDTFMCPIVEESFKGILKPTFIKLQQNQQNANNSPTLESLSDEELSVLTYGNTKFNSVTYEHNDNTKPLNPHKKSIEKGRVAFDKVYALWTDGNTNLEYGIQEEIRFEEYLPLRRRRRRDHYQYEESENYDEEESHAIDVEVQETQLKTGTEDDCDHTKAIAEKTSNDEVQENIFLECDPVVDNKRRKLKRKSGNTNNRSNPKKPRIVLNRDTLKLTGDPTATLRNTRSSTISSESPTRKSWTKSAPETSRATRSSSKTQLKADYSNGGIE